MLKVIVVCVILCLPKYLDAAVAIQTYVEKPAEFADQEGCYNPHLNMVLPYNEPYTPINGDYCEKYVCYKDNTTHIMSCGSVGYDKERCTLTYDYTQAYPCCCGTINCNGIKKNVGGSECH